MIIVLTGFSYVQDWYILWANTLKSSLWHCKVTMTRPNPSGKTSNSRAVVDKACKRTLKVEKLFILL